jgi:hypothetical protein
VLHSRLYPRRPSRQSHPALRSSVLPPAPHYPDNITRLGLRLHPALRALLLPPHPASTSDRVVPECEQAAKQGRHRSFSFCCTVQEEVIAEGLEPLTTLDVISPLHMVDRFIHFVCGEVVRDSESEWVVTGAAVAAASTGGCVAISRVRGRTYAFLSTRPITTRQ